MDKTRIIQQGEVAKFQVAIKDFDQDANDFRVEIVYGYRQNTMVIEKADMIGTEGLWYFAFDTAPMTGRVIARCVWEVPDTDVEGGYREKVNEQFLCFVVTTPCPQFVTCPACEEDDQVVYTRTDESEIADKYQPLVDLYNRPLVTSDGEYLFVANILPGDAGSTDGNGDEAEGD